MAALDVFPARVALVDVRTGRLTPEGFRAFNALWLRAGGYAGLSASDISNTPAGSISGTTVQDALNELDTEKVPTTRTVNGYPLSGNVTLSAADVGAQAADADLTSWAGVVRASGFDTFVATPSSANLASLVTDETGSGSLVFGTQPTLTRPTLVNAFVDEALFTEQPAITVKNASATLTVAELLTRIIQDTAAGATNLTLPTGADLNAGMPAGFTTDMSFDFDVINTGGGSATLVVNTDVTNVGSLSVASGSSAHFRMRRDTATTWVVYRLGS